MAIELGKVNVVDLTENDYKIIHPIQMEYFPLIIQLYLRQKII